MRPRVQVYRGIKTHQVTAVASRIFAIGNAGEIELIIGLDSDGTIHGVRVLSHAVTPGRGDKIDDRKSDWILGFNGKSLKNTTSEQWREKRTAANLTSHRRHDNSPRRRQGHPPGTGILPAASRRVADAVTSCRQPGRKGTKRMTSSYRTIAWNGLWDINIVLSQNLALCPTLAVTSTATNGLGMGLATTVVLVATGLFIAPLRRVIVPEVRFPVFVLIIATIVTLFDMGMNAWLHDLHKVLGLFIPLIVTNCAILGRAEAFASRNAPLPAMTDALMMGLGFTLALVTLGAVREILGSGTLFANA
jgi:RnfABCDGE-type electron transport complex E subunit